MNTSNYTHITVVLDQSGSIEPIRDDTIGGFNQFVEDQRKQPSGKSTITLVLFNTERRVVYSRLPLNEVPRLTRKTFIPDGGTALLDAIGASIADTVNQIESLPQDQRPSKVVVVILTDGQENSSREFSRANVFALIRERQENAQWQFLFLGANQDAIQEGGKLGISAGNSLTFEPSGAGAQASFASVSKFVQTFATLARPPPSFSAEDREAQERLSREKRQQRPSKN